MDEQTVEVINRVLPILLLLFLGYWTRRSGFLSESVMEGLRKIVVNLALPAVLFLSFLQVELKLSYVAIFVTIFLLCVALYAIGRPLGARLAPEHPYFPFLMTGFEYGMLGISLFGSAYGLEKLGYIAVIGVGHELFIWFVFLPLLLRARDGRQRPSDLIRSFLSAPVILAILAGIGLNLLGLKEALPAWPVTGGVLAAMEFLGSLTAPLILLIVGHGIQLDHSGLGDAAQVVAVRLGILIPLALLLNALLIRGVLGLEKGFETAVFTLLILPPPFIIPIFMRQDLPQEKHYVNNALMLYTLVTVGVFVVYFVLNP
ncbi:MAG: AEC family transporter [Ardenticatenaceae bacterium]|nr:AEC family transporter [Ardenticatenaceae bacterium]MCB8988586.1 AEC family transporter [Ardenticatenaceae bacterium]